MLELTESQQERTSISIYQNIFGAIGGLGIVLVPILFNQGLEVFRIFVIILGIMASTLYFVSSYIIKERVSLHQDFDDSTTDSTSSILKDLKGIFKNKAFLVNMIFTFSVWFIHGSMTQYSSIMGYVIKQEGFELIINGIFYLGTYPAYLALHYLAKKIEIEKIIVKITVICLMAISTLFIIDLIFNVPILYLIIIYFSGILFSYILYDFVLFSNVIDLDESKTGERKEARYSATRALITIPMGQFVGIIGASVLMVFNFQEGVDSYLGQPETAIFGIKLLIAVVPIVFSFVILLTQYINPLKGAALVEMKKKILKLHEEKEKTTLK